jgi:DNA-binding transcriptional LysR family regulator
MERMSNWKNLDIDDLYILRGLKNGSQLTHMADELTITQSALSHRVSRLRRSFDQVLVEKKGWYLVPTGEGREIMEAADKALRILEESVRC